MPDAPARVRLRLAAAPTYDASALANAILTRLEEMERASNTRPQCDRLRSRTGLLCAPEHRGLTNNRHVETAITGWLAEFFPNAESEVTDLDEGARPDIVFAFECDPKGDDVLVILEAKPVWKRWITTGEREYTSVTTDEYGRSTGNYADNNVRQVLGDRDKLVSTYTDPRDRLMLLALVFQRPGELDQRLINGMGPGWSVKTRHVVDLCNPPSDNIGVTGMVFWPVD